MSHFNFQNLSPEEFEALAKDIMQRLLGMPLFRYAAGPDGGIDLCDDLLTNRIIVQCKRYRDYKSLLQSLKDERKKLERLAPTPEKYYVFTSVGLLPQQKKTVLELFQPYMDSEANIFDAIAIEDFFNAPQNYDLIGKNKNLFVAYPVGYDQREESERQDLRDRLDELLRNTWKAHRSYKLMQSDEIDRKLFPNIQDASQFKVLGKRTGEEAESPVWAIIRESWNEATSRPVMIQGKGGIGKTVTLFSLTNINKDTIPAPAVYVPMFELVNRDSKVVNLTDYFQSPEFFPSLTIKQRESLSLLASKPWNRGPSLLVLLDGFNEVPSAQRWNVLTMLRKWHRQNQGAQLIAVSRPMDNLSMETAFGKETISVTLSEMSRETVAAYLQSAQGRGARQPETGAPIWETIVYPLFLNLYIKTDSMRDQQVFKDYPLNIRQAAGPGSLIWNYLQRELLKIESEDRIIKISTACEYIIPRIAFKMLSENSYTISGEEIDSLTIQTLRELSIQKLPKHLRDILAWYMHYHHRRAPSFSVNSEDEQDDWCDAVLRDSGLLIPYEGASMSPQNADLQRESFASDDMFSFPHQNFRDCLAGLYLVNQAEMAEENKFPEIWGKSQNHLAWNYVAELMEPSVYRKLWEANRKAQQYLNSGSKTNHTAVCNLLELWKRNDSLSKELDFSGMDLRGLSFTHYFGKYEWELPLFPKSHLLKDTLLDRSVFESKGHSGSITVLATLPNGQLISGSSDSTLRVWDATTGQCFQTLKGHVRAVTCIAILSDRCVISGSIDCRLRVWDVATGNCLQTLKGHKSFIGCVAVLPNGRVVSGSNDKTLRVWDTATGQCLQTLRSYKSEVTCVAVLPNGRVVSGSWDGKLRVWDSYTGRCLQNYMEHILPATCVAVLPNGRVVSGSWNGILRVWDTATAKCLQTLEGHTNDIVCIAVLPDGRVVSGSMDTTLRVWDAATGQCLQILDGHIEEIRCLAVLPDGRMASGSLDRTLRVWDTATGKCLQTMKGHLILVTCVTVIQNGRVVSGSQDGTLRVWDITTGKYLQALEGHRGYVGCVAVLPDGRVVSGSSDRTLRVWDITTGRCLQILAGHEESVTCVAVLPDGRVVSGSPDCTLRVWDATTGQCLQTLLGHTQMVNCIAVLSNGLVISGSGGLVGEDNTLRVWDTATGQCLKTLVGHRDAILCIAVLSNGRVVSGSLDHTLRVWDTATGKCLQILAGHEGAVDCVAVLPDGRVVSGSENNTLRVWDLSTGKCLQTLEEHTGNNCCVAVLPDGRVICGSNEGTLWIMDSNTGQCLRALKGHTNCVVFLYALPDGRVVSGSNDNTLRIWDPNTGSCLDVLEAMEVDASHMDFSEAKLTDDLARLLWHNGAKISDEDYERYTKPFRKAYNR